MRQESTRSSICQEIHILDPILTFCAVSISYFGEIAAALNRNGALYNGTSVDFYSLSTDGAMKFSYLPGTWRRRTLVWCDIFSILFFQYEMYPIKWRAINPWTTNAGCRHQLGNRQRNWTKCEFLTQTSLGANFFQANSWATKNIFYVVGSIWISGYRMLCSSYLIR